MPLGNQTFKIHIAYDKPQATGNCGGDNAGHLTIYANNKVILDNLPFNQACSNFNVSDVIYQGTIKELSINVKQENTDSDNYKGFMLTYHKNLNAVLINYDSLIKRIKH
jgi:uncharacterized protein YlaN (UPF0358 family)